MLTEALTTTVFRRFDDAALVQAWQQLAADTAGSAFASHWWAAVQPGPAASPLAVLVSQAGRPVAVAAFSLQGGHLMIAAGQFRDYSDWLCAADPRACADAVARALPWQDIQRIRIAGLKGGDPLGDALYAQARRAGLRGWLGQIDQAPRLSLLAEDGSRFSSYRFVFKSKNSKRLKIALAKKGEVAFWKVASVEEIGPAVDRLAELHIRRWAGTTTPSGLADPRRREVLRRIGEAAHRAGCLHFCELRLDGTPIASSLGYVTGATYGFHAVAFNAHVPGNSSIRSHLAYLLDDLAEATGVTCFDFLSGGEDYKLALASSSEPLRLLDMRRQRLPAGLARLKGQAFEAIYQRPAWYARAKQAKARIGALRQRLRTPVAELRRLAAEFGLRVALGKALRRALARWHDDTALALVSLPLDNAAPAGEGAPVDIAPGGFLDYAELVALRFGGQRSAAVLDYDGRVQSGMQLFVARVGGQLVASGWLQVGGTYAPTEIGARRPVEADVHNDAYVIDVWTAPARRGQRLLSILLAHFVQQARRAGLQGRLHAVIDVRNRPSRRGFARFGFVERAVLRR